MSNFQYTLVQKKSSQIPHADCLSRIPCEDNWSIESEENYISFVDYIPISATDIKIHTSKDPILARVSAFVQYGWTDESSQDPAYEVFKRKHLELSMENGCILWGSRVSQQEKIKNLNQNERRFKPGDKVWVRVEVEQQMIYKPANIVKKVSENSYDIELNRRLRHTSSEHLFDRDPLADPISLKALPRPAIEIPENEHFLVQNPTPVPVINSANNSTPVASSPGELATQVPSVQSSSATPAKATPILTSSNPTSSCGENAAEKAISNCCTF
ncbi:hypothetical protein FOCC_FOCC012846 [Frankliniella occidentalis]|nr:hypothetical protein FOCC_FOCC012846 [Frankliniella occidentalis]